MRRPCITEYIRSGSEAMPLASPPRQSNEYPMIEAFIQLPVFNPNKHYTMRGLFVGSGPDATRAIARETANHIPQSMKAF